MIKKDKNGSENELTEHNILNEGEKIPVLAEAEEKSIAEFILAETKEDGSTIRSLSLFFFRLP